MRHFKILSIFVLAMLFLVIAPNAQEELNNEELLTRLDEVRFVQAESWTFTVDILAQRPDGEETATVRLLFKEIDGEDYSRVEFLSPSEEVGNIYLTTPEGTFFSSPDVAEPLLISGSQSVFGDATVVQTVGIPFEGDYQIASRENVTLESGTEAIELMLESVDDSVTYPSVSVVVESETLEILTMTVFALSGDPVNQVTFENFAEVADDRYAQRQLIESQLIPENRTLLTITEVDIRDLSDDLFDPEQL